MFDQLLKRQFAPAVQAGALLRNHFKETVQMHLMRCRIKWARRPQTLVILTAMAIAILVQAATAAEPISIDVSHDFEQTRPMFSFGPKCRFTMPSIHVYSLTEERFLGGDALARGFPELAGLVASRSNPGPDCPADVPRERLESVLGLTLPSSGPLAWFYFDMPEFEPFANLSQGVRDKREQTFKMFLAIDSDAKVHLTLKHSGS